MRLPDRNPYQGFTREISLVPEFERIFFMLISKVFMTVEIGLLIQCEINFFYVYFNGPISDRRPSKQVNCIFHPTAYGTRLYAITTILNEPSK